MSLTHAAPSTYLVTAEHFCAGASHAHTKRTRTWSSIVSFGAPPASHSSLVAKHEKRVPWSTHQRRLVGVYAVLVRSSSLRAYAVAEPRAIDWSSA